MDVFISKLDAFGNFIYAQQLKGTSYNYVRCIFLEANGDIYMTGAYDGTTDFDPNAGVTTLSCTSLNGFSTYVHKMSQSPLEVKESNFKNNISIYPNPTTGILNIELENNDKVKIEVANALGEIVFFEETLESKNVKLNIKNLNSGLYVLKVISNDEIISTQKIIKN